MEQEGRLRLVLAGISTPDGSDRGLKEDKKSKMKVK